MIVPGPDGDAFVAEEPPQDGRKIVKWIELLPSSSQAQYALDRLNSLLHKAAQPQAPHSSKNACMELCYFVEQCRSSSSSQIQNVALSEHAALEMFNFYFEANDKAQSRQTKQVIELVASLLAHHPDKRVSGNIKNAFLVRLVSILTHQAAQPLVKPAFKALDLFLAKGSISRKELLEAYERSIAPESSDYYPISETLSSWDRFISTLFDWMTFPDISPGAGKCLVTLFRQVKSIPEANMPDDTLLWQRWIRNGLDKEPDALENVKNHLFPPLFIFDRPGSMKFLQALNKQTPIHDIKSKGELNAHMLLQLAAIEAGKKAGLIEERSPIPTHRVNNKATKPIILEENMIGFLATCEVATVRSLAFSVLIASPSPLRPFTPVALDIMQLQMGILYADTDAKFRTDALSNTRKLIERLRGTVSYLNKEVENFSMKSGLDWSKISPEESALDDQTQKILQKHKHFIEWYLKFLLGELVPTASYQRHITALKAIRLLLNSGIFIHSSNSDFLTTTNNASSWPYRVNFFATRAMRLLLDLIMDPFEDVRSIAAALLKFSPAENFVCNEKDELGSYEPKLVRTREIVKQHPQIQDSRAKKGVASLMAFIARAEDLAKRTGRADYGDGVARCYELLYTLLPTTESRLKLVTRLVSSLEAKIDTAEQNLANAVSDAPVHGIFAALNLVWESIDLGKDFYKTDAQDSKLVCEEWKNLQLRIVSLCSRTWDQVKDVLCNDSPEGHLPQGLDDIDIVDTKDVLSYSFRAIDESSNLLRSMATKLKFAWGDGSTIIPVQVFAHIRELTFEQLSTLRHRGAFTTVALTFSRCCQLTQARTESGELIDHGILERWYQGTLRCIFEQVSTTRRSAGIPTLMTSILSANSPKPDFGNVMKELSVLARRPIELSEKDETSLPQVHAMNCLKEIFKSSLLSTKAEPHIAECLQLAADSLNSEIWAIRNCGLLLLRSLIDSLFGTSESKAFMEAGWDGRSIRLSYDRYPSLPELLVKLLNTSTSNTETITGPMIGAIESVFPALDIIRRAGPPPTHRYKIFGLVSKHLGSRIWHIREIAARTLCTLLLQENWISDIISLIESLEQSANTAHGILLAIKFTLDRRLELYPLSSTDGVLLVISAIDDSAILTALRSTHGEVLAAQLDVKNTIANILLSSRASGGGAKGTLSISSVVGDIFKTNPTDVFALLQEKYLAKSADAPGDAALSNAFARHAIYTAALSDDDDALQNFLLNLSRLNPDVVLAALGCVSVATKNHYSLQRLFGISRTYIMLLDIITNPEICACICYELADVLDRAFLLIQDSESHISGFIDLLSLGLADAMRKLSSALGATDSPSLSNAHIRMTGFLMIDKVASRAPHQISKETCRAQMTAWGKLLWKAGNDNNDFDTRHAAAAAMHSFYGHPQVMHYQFEEEAMLCPFLALYNVLNDDDDDIRDLGAQTVSKLLHRSLVPLAARVELVNYVKRLQGSNSVFAWNAVYRMTGNHMHPSEFRVHPLEPASAQFARALKDNDSLFIEEDQNLFVDEVREIGLWSNAFAEIDLRFDPGFDTDGTWEQSCIALRAWVMEGITAMANLLDRDDGPLGWTSKPSVFAVCMSILLSAKAIIQFNKRLPTTGLGVMKPVSFATKDIESSLERFASLGADKNIHASLLSEVQGIFEDSSSETTKSNQANSLSSSQAPKGQIALHTFNRHSSEDKSSALFVFRPNSITCVITSSLPFWSSSPSSWLCLFSMWA